MSLRHLALAALMLCVAASAARAQPAGSYFVSHGGAQFQFGRGQLMPLQPATTGGTMSSPVGTGTMFPPLLIPVTPVIPKRFINQTMGPDPKQVTIPPGVFHRPAPAGAKIQGIARHHEKVFQVRTRVEFSLPAATPGPAVLKAGGRTGAPVTTFAGVPALSNIRYSKTAAQFGGPAQARIVPASPIQLWIDPGAMLPCKHPAFGGANASCIAPLVVSAPGPLVAAGGPVGVTVMTAGGTPATNIVLVSVPNTTGLIAASVDAMAPQHFTNMATSAGFPWTTGMITISQPTAAGTPEVFTITGMDGRVNGIGTLSLVSGSLSQRALTGPNSNRGWFRLGLPEPDAMLGAATALAVLALCHGAHSRRVGRG